METGSSGPGPARRRFPRARRLTRGAELERVRREGKRIRTARLEVRVLASPSALGEGAGPAAAAPDATAPATERAPAPPAPPAPPGARVGIIVPKYRQSSVRRNLVKRRLRELLRLHLLPRFAGLDVELVVRAAPAAYGATFAQLRKDLEYAARELRRLVAPPPSQPPSSDVPTPRPAPPPGAPDR